MTKCPNHGARQGGFARPEIAFEENDHPRLQQWRQHFAQALGGRLVGQFENGGNIGAMHDQDSTVDYAALKEKIREAGKELGFAAVGVARAEPGLAVDKMREWLAAGCHGEMDYMARHAELRANPQQLHPGTITVISVAIDYLPPGKSAEDPEQAVISRYAQGRDYHKVVRSRLQKLADAIAGFTGPFGYRVFSDSAPVMEVEFARQAGLGWRGKHTLLLNREAGSMFFLGEIYVDVALPASAPVEPHCGSCSACISACPTQAIIAPHRLDARRCISYLTIEHAGPIPLEMRPLLGNRIYGCDDCQLVCPWNKFAQRSSLPDFDAREGLAGEQLATLLDWTEDTFLKHTEGSPIRRIGHARWLRNVAVALGNALHGAGLSEEQRATMVQSLQRRASHPDPLVQEHVQWALAPNAPA